MVKRQGDRKHDDSEDARMTPQQRRGIKAAQSALAVLRRMKSKAQIEWEGDWYCGGELVPVATRLARWSQDIADLLEVVNVGPKQARA
jgi:hypothetical protein